MTSDDDDDDFSTVIFFCLKAPPPVKCAGRDMVSVGVAVLVLRGLGGELLYSSSSLKPFVGVFLEGEIPSLVPPLSESSPGSIASGYGVQS